MDYLLNLFFLLVWLVLLLVVLGPIGELIVGAVVIVAAVALTPVILIAKTMTALVRWALPPSNGPSLAMAPSTPGISGAAVAMPKALPALSAPPTSKPPAKQKAMPKVSPTPPASPPSQPPPKAKKKRTHPPRRRRAVRYYKGRLPLEHGAIFYIDECLSPQVAAHLNDHGLDVATIADSGLKGRDDEEHLMWAACARRILISLDNDFPELHKRGELHAGILHLKKQDEPHIQELLRRCLVLQEQHPARRP